MLKLFGYYVKEQQTKLVWLFGISLVLILVSLMLSHFEHPLWLALGSLSMVASLLVCALAVFAVLLISSLQFKDTFYTGPAYLYRTLPFSRLQLFACCFGSALLCLFESMLWLVLMVMIRFYADLDGLFASIAGLTDMSLLWLALAVYLQGTVLLLIGDLGIAFGFSRKSDKLAWSLLGMVGLYVLTNLVMAIGILPTTFSAMDDLAQINLLMVEIALIYFAVAAVYTVVLCVRLKNGVDIDG